MESAVEEPCVRRAAAEALEVPEEEVKELLALKGNGGAEHGYEWETFKENVRPLKRGRKVSMLNKALRAHHSDPTLRSQLLLERSNMIQAIQDYHGDDPLLPWLQCIKWIQECFPASGECSGLVVIYEQCVRSFWHDERYRDDLRYLKLWIEYAGNCADVEVIFNFLDTNQIGQSHALFYDSYASHLESRNKLRKADDIFRTGIARKAKPLEKLEDAYRSFLARSTRMKQCTEDDVSRNFGTLLNPGDATRRQIQNASTIGQKVPLQRIDTNVPLSIYNDKSSAERHQSNDKLKKIERPWPALGTRSERNKENATLPAKWATFKVPQKVGARTAQSSPRSCIDIYVDDDCSGITQQTAAFHSRRPSLLKLREANSQTLKKETELLKEDPLRNFRLTSLR